MMSSPKPMLKGFWSHSQTVLFAAFSLEFSRILLTIPKSELPLLSSNGLTDGNTEFSSPASSN